MTRPDQTFTNTHHPALPRDIGVAAVYFRHKPSPKELVIRGVVNSILLASGASNIFTGHTMPCHAGYRLSVCLSGLVRSQGRDTLQMQVKHNLDPCPRTTTDHRSLLRRHGGIQVLQADNTRHGLPGHCEKVLLLNFWISLSLSLNDGDQMAFPPVLLHIEPLKWP